MKRIISVLVFSYWVTACHLVSAGPLKDCSFSSVSNYYTRVATRLAPKDLPFDSAYARPLSMSQVSVEYEISRMTDAMIVDAPFHVIVNARSGAILYFWNLLLHKHISTNAVQKAPQLSVPEALAKAKSYLEVMELDLPADVVIQTVLFGSLGPSQWEVKWVPSAGGYAYDNFITPYVQSLVVVFHEDYGFCGYGCDLNFPGPKSTVVKVTKEEAITRASKVAPLVMKTPFYQMARASGFKITGVKSAELKISAPNWLLDPARAVWIREKPPDETRLCWIVTFVTVDTMDRKGFKLSPVDILVYIDAGTGEVVGANFS